MKTVFKKITGVLLPPLIAVMISGCMVATQGTVIVPRINTLYLSLIHI